MELKIKEQLYELVINKFPLNIESLKKNGFTEEEINTLLEQNIIKMTSSEEFQIINVSDLYAYGVKLLIYRNYRSAYLCFEKCHELDKSNRDVCLQLLLMKAKLGHFKQVFEIFEDLEEATEEKDRYDNNLYLYIFNLLTTCPEKYHQRLEELDYDSILIPHDSDILNIGYENRIRQSIMKSKPKYALKLLNDKLAQNRKYSIKDELLKTLTLKVIQADEQFKQKLLELAQNKQYNAILSFIESKTSKRYLSNEETYIKIITETILEIQKTHVIPIPTVYYTDHIYDAIIGNNFKLALELEKRFVRTNSKNRNDDVVYFLLLEINKIILEIQKEDLTQKTLIK